MRRTIYEWTVELLSSEDEDDIIDVTFWDTREAASDYRDSLLQSGLRAAWGLVRSVGEDDIGLLERGYAYIDETGSLPEEFDDGIKVPKRFRS